MNSTLHTLDTMAAIALYQKKGIIDAILFLMAQGWTQEDAIDMITLYERYGDEVDAGKLTKKGW